ncbi:MAG: hypothetical protein WC292_05900 [Clostridia bacterium]
MRWKTNLKISFTFIGMLIGAGFASGKEIAVYFGTAGVAAPLLASFLCGGLAFVFLELGRISGADVLSFIFPKTYKVWQFICMAENFVVFAAMLAASEYILRVSLGISGGGLISGLFALTSVLGGIERIKTVNFIAVPFIIVMLAVLYLAEPSFNISGGLNLPAPILYASMNIFSGGFLISKMAKGIDKKQAAEISLIISLVLSVLIVTVYLAVRTRLGEEMPLLALAQNNGLSAIGSMLIYSAIITSMSGSLVIASGGKKTAACILLAAGFVVALAGFSNIVRFAYPVIGVAGAAFGTAAIVRLLISSYKEKRELKI